MSECKDDKLPEDDCSPGTPEHVNPDRIRDAEDPEVPKDEIQDADEPEVPQPELEQVHINEVRRYGGSKPNH